MTKGLCFGFAITCNRELKQPGKNFILNDDSKKFFVHLSLTFSKYEYKCSPLKRELKTIVFLGINFELTHYLLDCAQVYS